jgi:5-methylcytosine-specific restriction protein A
MPQAPPRACEGPSCPNTTTTGALCDDCRRAAQVKHWRSDRRANAYRRGYGRSWRKLRDRQLQLEPFCRPCRAAGRLVEATEVDHIVPRAQGGTDLDANLQSICHPCHGLKTARETRDNPVQSPV